MVQRTLTPRRVGSTPGAASSKPVGSPVAGPALGHSVPPGQRPAPAKTRAGTDNGSISPPRPHYLDRQPKPGSASSSYSSPVKIQTDDWMQVELPRTDYVQAGLVALGIAAIVGSVTLLPAIVFFNWLALASASVWAKSVAGLPIACGLLGAWACLRRAKSERIRARLLEELRN